MTYNVSNECIYVGTSDGILLVLNTPSSTAYSLVDEIYRTHLHSSKITGMLIKGDMLYSISDIVK